MRVALDTNVLAYAEGVHGAPVKKAALESCKNCRKARRFLPVQTLGELFNLLVRKARRPPAKVRKAILTWRDAFPLIETSAQVMLAAADLATNHQLSIWDSVVLSVRCRIGLPAPSIGRSAGRLHLERCHGYEPIRALKARAPHSSVGC